MAKKRDYSAIALNSTMLASEGEALLNGLWENGVYLTDNGFVYHITAEREGNALHTEIISKRVIGEYLRWVDGLFKPGEVPAAYNAIHFRAARRLREII